MTSQIISLTQITQKNFGKNKVSRLQKGAEAATAILMVMAFLIWFVALGA